MNTSNDRPRRARSTLGRVVWASFCLAVLGIGLHAMPSGADVPPIAVRQVDARDGDLTIDISRLGEVDPGDLEVLIDGKKVKPTSVQPLEEGGSPASVVVVLDNSQAMGNGAVQIAKEQLEQLAPGQGGIGTLGVVTIGGSANVLSEPTSSIRVVENAIGPTGPTGGAALYEGLLKASATFDDDTQNNIVLVTGSADAGVGARYPEVQEALRRAGVTLHVLALTKGTVDVPTLTQLVDEVGGTIQTGTSDDLETQFGVVAKAIDDQYRIKVAAPKDITTTGDLVPLEVKWGDASTEAAYRPGAVSTGAGELQPIESPGIIDRVFGSSLVKWLIVLMGTAAAGMVVYAVGMLIMRRKDGLDFALRHYESYTLEESPIDDDDDGSYAKGAMLKKAVAFTGDFAQRQGLLTRVEVMLERSDLPLRPAEALFFYAAIAFGASVLAAVLTRSALWFFAVLLLSLVAPKYVVDFLAKRRNKKFVGQLPDMLSLLAGTLRAGYSIGQGFEAVSQEIDDPMGKELRRVIAEARLGRALDEALDGAADRMKSDDFSWAVMAIRIQREVGGNLAELLMTVADTMTQRERLRRDVNSLTAEGRISAIVLGCLPPGLAAVMFVMNPAYIGRLFKDGVGIGMLVASAVAMLVGFMWMKKIIKIEI